MPAGSRSTPWWRSPLSAHREGGGRGFGWTEASLTRSGPGGLPPALRGTAAGAFLRGLSRSGVVGEDGPGRTGSRNAPRGWSRTGPWPGSVAGRRKRGPGPENGPWTGRLRPRPLQASALGFRGRREAETVGCVTTTRRGGARGTAVPEAPDHTLPHPGERAGAGDTASPAAHPANRFQPQPISGSPCLLITQRPARPARRPAGATAPAGYVKAAPRAGRGVGTVEELSHPARTRGLPARRTQPC